MSTNDNKTLLQPELLELLVCPITKGSLKYNKEQNELVSKSARLAYPVVNGFPVLTQEQARQLTEQELEK